MDGKDQDLVDVDLYDDGSFPEDRFGQAPGAAEVFAAIRGTGPVPATGLVTRRQLRALGLSPGGQEPLRYSHGAAGYGQPGSIASSWLSRKGFSHWPRSGHWTGRWPPGRPAPSAAALGVGGHDVGDAFS